MLLKFCFEAFSSLPERLGRPHPRGGAGFGSDAPAPIAATGSEAGTASAVAPAGPQVGTASATAPSQSMARLPASSLHVLCSREHQQDPQAPEPAERV